MRRSVFAILSVLLLMLPFALPAACETETDSYTLGSFTYSIPASWAVRNDKDGKYHFAGGEGVIEKGYVYACIFDFGEPCTDELTAKAIFSGVIGAMTEKGGKMTLLSRFDVQIQGKYATLLRMGDATYKQSMTTSYVCIINGSEVFMLFYTDQINMPDDQLKVFSDIVGSITIEE